MRQETARFKCTDDDGNVYVIIKRTYMVQSKPISGQAQTTKGANDYIFADGSDVNELDSKTFQIVQTDKIRLQIKSVFPSLLRPEMMFGEDASDVE